ncbi:uncharacterized protein (TIGR02145 family) [Fibrobacter sp. UWR1]|nr:uncharacterized protein (TIGR02145 family) [Fibrobacter sp. UWR1]
MVGVLKRVFLGTLLLLSMISLNACGENSASGVDDDSETSVTDSSSSEDSSSSSRLSSSSNKKFRSSSSTQSSSSRMSSSSRRVSSSSNDESPSSSSGMSSSSDEESSSSTKWTSTVLPPGKYDCSIYKCAPTDYLNPNVKYGEYLDVRDSNVYHTIMIDDEEWFAEDLRYIPEKRYGEPREIRDVGYIYDWRIAQGTCPDGWHIPSYVEWRAFINSVVEGDAYSSLAADGFWWWERCQNKTGFSALYHASYRYSASENYHYIAAYASSDVFDKDNGYVFAFEDRYSNFYGMSYSYDQKVGVRCKRNGTDYPKPPEYEGYKGLYGVLVDERDGHSYKTVTINGKEWMAENLNFDVVGSECDFPDNCEENGRNYSWVSAVAMDSSKKECERKVCLDEKELPIQGVCPSGWHIPDSTELGDMFTSVGCDSHDNGSSIVYYECTGHVLKSNKDWRDHKNGKDSVGFGMKPSFYEHSSKASFWTVSERDSYAKAAEFLFTHDYALIHDKYKRAELSSVRCVKD